MPGNYAAQRHDGSECTDKRRRYVPLRFSSRSDALAAMPDMEPLFPALTLEFVFAQS